MTAIGFELTQLSLVGNGLADATVQFGPGLNVISGPSDTGKTFIAECIDYGFGASTKPSDIPEAHGYESVVLGIRARSDGREYSIRRSLRGGGAVVSTPGETDRVLGEKHQPDNPDTISTFLLSLCGLETRLVRTNAQGKTRQTSFRDLAQLIVVAEQDVIRKHSPIRSGQVTDKTVEDSVFRLLLTGVDDASVVAASDKSIVTAEARGKSELLGLLMQQAAAELDRVAPGSAVTDLEEQLRRINSTIEEATTQVAAEQRGAAELEERRRTAWTRLRENQSRLAVLDELQQRFSLLKAQYSSDLRRLESIAETGLRLGQLSETRCPVCGAESKYHTQLHPDHAVAPGAVAEACSTEAARLQLLVSDLDQTIAANAAETRKRNDDSVAQKGEMQEAERSLASYFKPRLNESLAQIREAREVQSRVRQAIEIHSRIQQLTTLRDQASSSVLATPKSKYVAAAGSIATEQLALKIEEILKAWQFPGLQRVTFSDADQDIVISGRRRVDHGKGVRAITHAAFTVGLMHYCVDKQLPHPGVVVIDSPLVVYREPDKDEADFSRSLKDLCYTYLADQPNRGQVILLENEDPPEALPDSPTVIRFTGAPHGRTGFVPAPPPVSTTPPSTH